MSPKTPNGTVGYPPIKTYREAEAKIEGILRFYYFSPAKAHRYAKKILRAGSTKERKEIALKIIDEARRIFSRLRIDEDEENLRLMHLHDNLLEVIESLEEAEAEAYVF